MLVLLPVIIEIKNAPDYDTLPNLSWYRSLRSVHVKGATLAHRDDAPPSRRRQNPSSLFCQSGSHVLRESHSKNQKEVA